MLPVASLWIRASIVRGKRRDERSHASTCVSHVCISPPPPLPPLPPSPQEVCFALGAVAVCMHVLICSRVFAAAAAAAAGQSHWTLVSGRGRCRPLSASHAAAAAVAIATVCSYVRPTAHSVGALCACTARTGMLLLLCVSSGQHKTMPVVANALVGACVCVCACAHTVCANARAQVRDS